MFIKSLKLKDFKLFKDQEISFGKINIIMGENYSGKSTLIKGIIFGYYGEASGTTLQKLISFDEKETTVELTDDKFKIIRKVPNEFQLFEDEKELQFNTATIKQNYLNKQIGDYEFFKKYRLINKQSINLLDYAKDSRSISTLRKELMTFITNDFEIHRKNLLFQKLDRERFSVDKKLYHFYLSQKRITILDKGLVKLQEELTSAKGDCDEQQEIINNLNSENKSCVAKIEFLNKQLNSNSENTEKNNRLIIEGQKKIDNLKNQPKKEPIKVIDYDIQLINTEKVSEQISAELEQVKSVLDSINKEIEELNFKKYSIDTDFKKLASEKQKLNKEIANLDTAKIGTKCDKCGSIVTIEYKDSYKKEKIQEISIIEKKEKELQEVFDKNHEQLFIKSEELENKSRQKTEITNKSDQIKKQIKDLNNKRFSQAEQLQLEETEEIRNTTEIEKLQASMQTYKTQIQTYLDKNLEMSQEVEQLYHKIEQLKTKIESEINCMEHYNSLYEYAQKRIQKVKECIMKLKEAEKFSEYKYNSADIQLYADSIKTFDDFAGWYIQNWLDNLTFVINDLLQSINLKVIFSADKRFLTIIENDRELDYNDLSSCQEIFLSVIFKLAILLHNGINDGIIIIDEGINEMKLNNAHKLINILKTLPFQIFLIYQNIDEIEDVNVIEVERIGNESRIK